MSEDNPEEIPPIPPEDSTISESLENDVVDEEIEPSEIPSVRMRTEILAIILASIFALLAIVVAIILSTSSAPEWARCQASLNACLSTPSPIPQTQIVEVTRIVEITVTPLPDKSPTEMSQEESVDGSLQEHELVFEEDFEALELDRNKWLIGCNPQSEALLIDGELHLRFKGHDETRSCILKPYIEDGQNISLISMKLTIKEGTNGGGWVGFFSDCGDRYFNFVGNKYQFSLSREFEVGGFQKVEAINSLPVTRIISIQKDDGKVTFTTAENYDEILYALETTCYTNFSEIRIGVDTDISQAGEVYAVIDDVKIWALDVQPTPAE